MPLSYMMFVLADERDWYTYKAHTVSYGGLHMVALNNISDEYKNSAKTLIIAGKEQHVWTYAVVCGIDPADLGDSYTAPEGSDTYHAELSRLLGELADLKAGA